MRSGQGEPAMAVGETVGLPQPPFIHAHLDYLNVVCEFEDVAIRAVLAGTGLEPAPPRTGGFLIYIAPPQERLGRFSVSQAWVDVAGYDSTDGSHARMVVGGWYSGIYAEVSRRIYRAPVEDGEASLETSDDEVIGRAGPRGRDAFRIRSRLLPGEPVWRTYMHFYVRPLPDGRVMLHHVGHSSLARPAEPISLDNLLPPDTAVGSLRPVRLIRTIRQEMHLSVGVPIEAKAAAAAEPHLIYLLSRLNRGALLIDRSGRISFVNPRAEALVGPLLTPADAAGSPRRGRPPLDTAIAQLACGPAGHTGPTAIPRSGGRHPLLATGVALGSEDAAGNPRRAVAMTLVLLTDPEDPAEPRAAASLELLGLTPAEARVATLVGSGLGPREVAGILGTSEGTVRVQLQRAYGKLDISRQNELAAMVARVARLDL